MEAPRLATSSTWLRRHAGIWPQEPFSIKVDEVVRRLRHPHFGFPGDEREETPQSRAGFEGGHKDETCRAAAEECLKLVPAFSINCSSARHGFDQRSQLC